MGRCLVSAVAVVALLAGCDTTPSSSASSQPSRPSILAKPLSEVRLDCSNDVFQFGPSGLATNYQLPAFDARAIAERDASFYGYDADQTDVCEQATAEAKERYDAASRRGWRPYGQEERWLYRWDNYYLCASAIVSDFPGATHRLIIGATTVRRAAQSIAHDTDRPELWQPAFDGCAPGLRLGLQLRATNP